MRRKFVLLLLVLLSAILLAARVVAAPVDAHGILDQARKLEADGISLFSESFRFEEALVSEDNDRLMVFLSMPHGARVIVDQISITLDGKLVHQHAYSVSELMLLQGRAAQLFYVSRLAPGEHVLRIDVKTMQGKVLPMRAYAFVKERAAKYIDVQISGAPVRQIEVVDW